MPSEDYSFITDPVDAYSDVIRSRRSAFDDVRYLPSLSRSEARTSSPPQRCSRPLALARVVRRYLPEFVPRGDGLELRGWCWAPTRGWSQFERCRPVAVKKLTPDHPSKKLT
jgi:hypothetical protein